MYVQCLVNQRKFLRWNGKSPHSFSNILHYSGCEDLALHEKKNKKYYTSLELKNTFQFKSLLFQTKKWVENTYAPKELPVLMLQSKNENWIDQIVFWAHTEHVW